jgi:hypothetical protein
MLRPATAPAALGSSEERARYRQAIKTIAEMRVAFIDNPQRKLDNKCAESIRIDWQIASWANAKK